MGKRTAGTVPIRRTPLTQPATNSAVHSWQVLLISARSNPSIWVLPKGGIEPNELPQYTALRETKEEAGVVGTLGAYMGEFSYKNNSVVSMWLLTNVSEVDINHWPERDQRIRRWFELQPIIDAVQGPGPNSQAICKLFKSEILDILMRVNSYLNSLPPGP